MSNNPPAATLELTQEEADFLIANLDAGLQQGLGILTLVQDGTMSMETAHKAVALMEPMRSITKKLKDQGIKLK